MAHHISVSLLVSSIILDYKNIGCLYRARISYKHSPGFSAYSEWHSSKYINHLYKTTD